MAHLYAIAIGSNRPHGRYGRPAAVVEAAIARLDAEFALFDASPIVLNAARRSYVRKVKLRIIVRTPPDVRRRLPDVSSISFSEERWTSIHWVSGRSDNCIASDW